MTKDSLVEITSQADIDQLMSSFGGFHDAILHRVVIANTEHIDKNGRELLDPSGFTFDALLLFQTDVNYVIEMLFERVVRFNLVPAEPNHSSQCWCARMRIREGTIYLMLDVNETFPEDWIPDDTVSEIIWIAAKRAFWRFADGGLGSQVSPPFRRYPRDT